MPSDGRHHLDWFIVRRCLLPGALLVGIAGCGEPSPAGVGERADCIVAGETASKFVKLSPLQVNAIMHIGVTVPGLSAEADCTGVLVQESWLLTAAHCVRSDAEELYAVRPNAFACGRNSLDPDRVTFEVSGSVIHPRLDLALLELTAAVPVEVAVPLRLAGADVLSLGDFVEIAGTGTGAQNQATVRPLFVVEQVIDIAAEHLDVRGFGESGACTGDSGGPLLTRARDGGVAVVGTLSGGSASCVGVDRFVRLDRAQEWIQRYVPSTPDVDETCGSIDVRGSCMNSMAIRCVDGVLKAQQCDKERVCSYSGDQEVGCVMPESTPCDDVSVLGRCEEGALLTCDGENILRTPCVACARSARDGTATCFDVPKTKPGPTMLDGGR